MRLTALVAAALALVLAAAPPGQAAERRVALVIGNSAYRHVQTLANPANDARLIAATLQSLGFQLVGGGAQIDLDKPGMDRAVAQLAAAISPGSTALFYYAGHGVQIDGANDLVAVNAEPQSAAELVAQSLAADRVLTVMARAGADIKLLLLDACRDNPFADMMDAPSGRGIRPGDPPKPAVHHAMATGLAVMRAPRGSIISFATQPGSVALDGAGADSPFSIALADSLRLPDLDAVQMLNRVGVEVNKATHDQQDPWLAIAALDHPIFLGRLAMPATAAPVMAKPATALPQAAMQQAAIPRPATGPHCPPAGLTVLRNGTIPVQYEGEAAPGICLQIAGGMQQSRGFGIWPANWDGAARAASALTEALGGPAGTSSTFTLSSEVRTLRLTTSEVWRITITNGGTGQINLAGQTRPTTLLQWQERSLAHPYTAEADLTLDRATGALLAQTFRVTQGNAGAAYDFWAKADGGLGAAGDFAVTALH